MMSVWISGYIVTLYYSISVRLHLSFPACFFLSVFHLLRSLCLLSLRTVPVCFISFIPSPLLFFMLFLFPSSSLPLLSCHSVSLLSPSALHSFFCLFFLLLSLWTCTRFSVFSFLSFLLSPTPSTSIPILDVMPGRVADACLPGLWGAAGVCNDHGKTYALYAITVFRRNHDGSEDCWKTYRRYSDFHDFHMRITETVCSEVSGISTSEET